MELNLRETSEFSHFMELPEYTGQSDWHKDVYEELCTLFQDVKGNLTVEECATYYCLVTLVCSSTEHGEIHQSQVNTDADNPDKFNIAHYYILNHVFGLAECRKQFWWNMFIDQYPDQALMDEAEHNIRHIPDEQTTDEDAEGSVYFEEALGLEPRPQNPTPVFHRAISSLADAIWEAHDSADGPVGELDEVTSDPAEVPRPSIEATEDFDRMSQAAESVAESWVAKSVALSAKRAHSAAISVCSLSASGQQKTYSKRTRIGSQSSMAEGSAGHKFPNPGPASKGEPARIASADSALRLHEAHQQTGVKYQESEEEIQRLRTLYEKSQEEVRRQRESIERLSSLMTS